MEAIQPNKTWNNTSGHMMAGLHFSEDALTLHTLYHVENAYISSFWDLYGGTAQKLQF